MADPDEGRLMGVRKKPSGKFEATLKDGRVYVGAKSFDRKGDAESWLTRERAALAGGVDHKASKVRLTPLLEQWVEYREGAGSLRMKPVAEKTARTDRELLRLVPPALGNLQVGAIRPRHIDGWYTWLGSYVGKDGRTLGASSVRRYRQSLSSFFTYCVRNGYRLDNPVTASRPPRATEEVERMRPWSEPELVAFLMKCRKLSEWDADVATFCSWSGLRWSEVRAVQVKAFQQFPTASIHATRAQVEGGSMKPLKSYQDRWVPITNDIVPVILRLAAGKKPDDLLVTGPNGGQLWGSNFRRALNWNVNGEGRTVHDMRHSAACIWLRNGVDLSTVQKWLGHESVQTTNRYVHWLGTASDVASLDLLNNRGGVQGVSGAGVRKDTLSETVDPENPKSASD